MEATGAPIPDIPIDVHVDAGATLTSLAIMAPFRAAGRLGCQWSPQVLFLGEIA